MPRAGEVRPSQSLGELFEQSERLLGPDSPNKAIQLLDLEEVRTQQMDTKEARAQEHARGPSVPAAPRPARTRPRPQSGRPAMPLAIVPSGSVLDNTPPPPAPPATRPQSAASAMSRTAAQTSQPAPADRTRSSSPNRSVGGRTALARRPKSAGSAGSAFRPTKGGGFAEAMLVSGDGALDGMMADKMLQCAVVSHMPYKLEAACTGDCCWRWATSQLLMDYSLLRGKADKLRTILDEEMGESVQQKFLDLQEKHEMLLRNQAAQAQRLAACEEDNMRLREINDGLVGEEAAILGALRESKEKAAVLGEANESLETSLQLQRIKTLAVEKEAELMKREMTMRLVEAEKDIARLTEAAEKEYDARRKLEKELYNKRPKARKKPKKKLGR